ncbi:hypothetical protein [Lichenicoccus sp.]|uniref:hypothetical protein n=1 Tax=Lichenicoccus sp. TaxID=2781899 RepID=UPI003D12491C
MADISDVEEAFCSLILGATYPGGVAVPSVTGAMIKIYRGWPINKTLNSDLQIGTQNVTVFSRPNSTRDTSRYPRIWRTTGLVAPTITITIDGSQATFGGTSGAGQTAGLLVDGIGYAYTLSADDSVADAAAALAAMIPSASSAGVVISLAPERSLQARVAGSGTAEMETRRQEQGLMVSVWCPTPGGRDALATAIDNYLSPLDWFGLPDGTVARLTYHSSVETDESQNASLYRRILNYTIEYPTTIRMTGAQMLFGIGTLLGDGGEVGFSCLAPPPVLVVPPLGAFRFDAWYDPANAVDEQVAAALSPAAFNFRLPANATINAGAASWPLATQATLDAEILAAVQAGLTFWAFDSYQPTDTLSLALRLYLSSSLRSKLQFCMLGQTSNWGEGGEDQPSLLRDISMMTQPGYMTVAGGRPLYLVLDASPAQTSGLPVGGVSAALALVRSQVQAAGGGNPYVVWLSGAALADYDNIGAARQVGADAAGAYAVPELNGSAQPYSSLALAAEQDWMARVNAGFPMVPTAMTGWDQRPLILDPQPFYPIAPSLTPTNYYETATASEVGTHLVQLIQVVVANAVACPAQIGLVYAWNELAEGGWLMPTWTPDGPDLDRSLAAAAATAAAIARSMQPSITLIS